jgi:hypothetical protein
MEKLEKTKNWKGMGVFSALTGGEDPWNGLRRRLRRRLWIWFWISD